MNRLPFCAYCPRETCIYTEGQRPVAACFGHRDYDASATLQASVIVHENRERLFYAISEKNVAISKARDIMQTVNTFIKRMLDSGFVPGENFSLWFDTCVSFAISAVIGNEARWAEAGPPPAVSVDTQEEEPPGQKISVAAEDLLPHPSSSSEITTGEDAITGKTSPSSENAEPSVITAIKNDVCEFSISSQTQQLVAEIDGAVFGCDVQLILPPVVGTQFRWEILRAPEPEPITFIPIGKNRYVVCDAGIQLLQCDTPLFLYGLEPGHYICRCTEQKETGSLPERKIRKQLRLHPIDIEETKKIQGVEKVPSPSDIRNQTFWK